MLQHFFKLVFRTAERKPVQAGGRQGRLPMGEARPDYQRPTAEFLAQVLRSALAQRNAESRGGRAVHQPSDEPPSQDAEQPDEKVARLMPRRRPTTEQIPNPPTHDDDNDPGPSAA
jgi:hypothetical protein